MIVLYLTIPDVYHNKGVLVYVGGALIMNRFLVFAINLFSKYTLNLYEMVENHLCQKIKNNTQI